jgi:threonine dehydratase
MIGSARAAKRSAHALAAEGGLSLIKPFDDPFVLAGQGTAGLEIAEQISPDIVFVPASGGGLATGTALSLPKARVFAVEPEGHDDIQRTLATGSIQRNEPGIRSICDGLLTEQMGEIPTPSRANASSACSPSRTRRCCGR